MSLSVRGRIWCNIVYSSIVEYNTSHSISTML